MPGALVSKTLPILALRVEDTHTEVVCVCVPVSAFCSMKKNICIDLLQANVSTRDR